MSKPINGSGATLHETVSKDGTYLSVEEAQVILLERIVVSLEALTLLLESYVGEKRGVEG